MTSFRATVENMSKLMDEMGITELDLERQLLLGLNIFIYLNNRRLLLPQLVLFKHKKQIQKIKFQDMF